MQEKSCAKLFKSLRTFFFFFFLMTIIMSVRFLLFADFSLGEWGGGLPEILAVFSPALAYLHFLVVVCNDRQKLFFWGGGGVHVIDSLGARARRSRDVVFSILQKSFTALT